MAFKKPFTMTGLIDRLWDRDRYLMSDDYDRSLADLAEIVDMRFTDVPTGTACSTWRVPEKWQCLEAWVETLDGRRVLDVRDRSCYCVAYSQPFEGEVSREELLAHLFSKHPVESNDSTDGAPFLWTFYYRKGWGLACRQKTKDALCDARYRVVIRTRRGPGVLRIGEAVLPGESDESFLICAHLCHAHMVQDGLTGVVAGLDALRILAERPRRRYTYRLILAPETIGGIAWIERNQDLMPRLRGGVYLDMVGLAQPAAVQLSYWADSEVDRCFKIALREREPGGWTGDFRKIVGNDERQFNGPGWRVPMVGLSRAFPMTHKYWPFREYHTEMDTPATVDLARLEGSRDLVVAAADLLERNDYPVNHFTGEIFLSGLGFDVDFYRDPNTHAVVMGTMHLIDGTHSIVDMVEETGFRSADVLHVIEGFRAKGVVSLAREPVDAAAWKPCARDRIGRGA